MRRSMMLCQCHACLDCKEVRRNRRAIRNHERSHKKASSPVVERVPPTPLDEMDEAMVQGLKLQAVEAEKQRSAAALLKIEENFDLGKKRTCPRCKCKFGTRKDLRLHRQLTKGSCEPPVIPAEMLKKHRYS